MKKDHRERLNMISTHLTRLINSTCWSYEFHKWNILLERKGKEVNKASPDTHMFGTKSNLRLFKRSNG